MRSVRATTLPVPPARMPSARPLVGERAKHLHHGPVAAECEHRVVLVRVGVGEHGRMSGGQRLHHVTRDTGVSERLYRFGANAQSPSRGGVDDQQHALDSPRSKLHRDRSVHAASRTLRTCIARLSAVNGF